MPVLREFITRHRFTLLFVAVLVSLTYLVPKYLHETQRILGWIGEAGGIDLEFYYRWTHRWFSGINIYNDGGVPDGYPPASMVILYPLAGWLNLEQTRWLWAITTILCFAVVALIAIRATGARGFVPRLALVALLLLNNGVSVTYGNGQATLLVLAALLPAILLLHRRPLKWLTDLLAAALFTIALLKPNLTAPYLWLLVIFPNAIRVRPLAFSTALYLVLSLAAAQFVNTPLPLLIQQFLANRLSIADLSLDPNVHFILGRLGLDVLLLPASALIWLGLGAWIIKHRTRDLWLVLAVTTLVMRFWGFHWLYDNVWLILPEIALIRTWQNSSLVRQRGFAFVVLIANIVVTLPPGNLGGQSETMQFILLFAQGGVWLVTLGFFLWSAAAVNRQNLIRNSQPIQMAIETHSTLL